MITIICLECGARFLGQYGLVQHHLAAHRLRRADRRIAVIDLATPEDKERCMHPVDPRKLAAFALLSWVAVLGLVALLALVVVLVLR